MTAGSSFAESAINNKKKKCETSANFKWTKPTSNTIERLFRTVRAIYTDYRKSVSPVNLEAQIFLKANKDYWDEKTVATITV